MSFEPAVLFAGFVFGTLGIYVFKEGRKRANVAQMLIGAALLVYPYFIESAWISWLIGSVLFFASFKV